jgi:hypothetical protein
MASQIDSLFTKKWVETVVVFALFMIVTIVSYFTQPPLSYNNGLGWDGQWYYLTAQQIAQGQKIVGPAPFNLRLGTPLLASVFFRENLINGFQLVNLAANALFVLLFIWWLKLFILKGSVRLLLHSLLMLQWSNSIRFIFYSRTYIDPWGTTFILLGLIGLYYANKQHNRMVVILCLSFITTLGLLFREIMVVIPVALLFATNPVYIQNTGKLALRKIPLTYFIPLSIAVIVTALIRLNVQQDNNYSFIRAIIDWLYEKAPLPYFHGWLIVFGPVLAFAIYDWRRGLNFLGSNQGFGVFFFGMAILGWLGGADHERFLCWLAPIIYVVIGHAIENSPPISRWLVGLIGIAQVISMRVFWITPDYPNSPPQPIPVLTQWGNNVQIFDLLSSYGNRRAHLISFVEYCFVIAFIIFILHTAQKKRQLNISA